ncbi:MAG: SpoIIIAH-like family protein [Eubacteriales bacterium]
MRLLGRKNILVFSLILILVVVGYLNYQMFFDDTEVADDEAPINAELVDMETENEIMTGTTAVTDEFFVDYKIERDKSRSEHIAMLESISKDETSDGETKTMAQQEMISLIQLSEKEMIIENLIKAKGFNDGIVFIHDGYVNVVIDANQLTTSQAAQIQDIVQKESGVEIQKISIATNNNGEE